MGHDRIYSREQNISSISSLHCAVNETAITEWKSEKNAFECVGEKKYITSSLKPSLKCRLMFSIMHTINIFSTAQTYRNDRNSEDGAIVLVFGTW